jgi:hypothetical protein
VFLALAFEVESFHFALHFGMRMMVAFVFQGIDLGGTKFKLDGHSLSPLALFLLLTAPFHLVFSISPFSTRSEYKLMRDELELD